MLTALVGVQPSLRMVTADGLRTALLTMVQLVTARSRVGIAQAARMTIRM